MRYAIQVWKEDPIISELISKNLITPDSWINIWKNKNHPEHKLLMKEILNNNENPHKIGNFILPYKWTYIPQSYYYKNPKYIIIMDNIYEELKIILNSIGIYNFNLNLPYTNSTIKTLDNDIISDENKEWLYNIYMNDNLLFNHYKNINVLLR